MRTPTYSFENHQEFGDITIENGEFVYQESPVYYAQYDIDGVSLYAQFNCGDSWAWYNGCDGGPSSWAAKHYFNREDEEFVEFLDEILSESKPDLGITTEQKAEYLRDYHNDDEALMALADKVKAVVPEKSDDFALVLAFYCKNGVSDVGAWECNMQNYSGLSKEQTLALAQIFLMRE